MFGYILPYRKKLSDQALAQYRADYCGLCRCLGKRYGFFARFLVSYDITFLYALLAAARLEGPVKACYCPANPFCRKRCREEDETMAYAADVSVIVSVWKLRDERADGGFWRRWVAGLLLRGLRGAERAANRRLPEFSRCVERQMARLRALEQARCASADRAADTFGALLQGCAAGDERTRRVLGQILYHVGRYLYLVDALDDLAKDVKTGNYNPLRYRYALSGGALRAEDKEEFLQSVDYSVGMAASALELLDCQSHRELLENIIYDGMPLVLKSVAAGLFRKNRSKA